MADGVQTDVYEAAKWPGDLPTDHLEFALKYDGTNLHILNAVFTVLPAGELAAAVVAKPTGRFARRLWYLFEWMTGQILPVPPLTQGNYVPLIEPAEQYTTAGVRSQRQRVMVNLLGDGRFCPIVRRTSRLVAGEADRLDDRGRQVLASCPPEVLRRAMHYLYTKETRSSFEIEREQPSTSRTAQFVALLHSAERESYVDVDRLLGLQNQIVIDPRFRATGYNDLQNYVGQTIGFAFERVHYVAPKPADTAALMDGWVACHHAMAAASIHPVVHAAVIAYAFVFIHPFIDGNGRIHRFLIHNVLANRAFTPPDVIFPVSAVMLRNAADYDRSLEAFSKPLMPLIDYRLDDFARMRVLNETAPLYRYADLTPQAEALFDFVRATIDHELVNEIRFIRQYDRAKRAIQEIVDMPDRLIDVFIHCWVDNHGRLSKRKRTSTFEMLSDDEVSRMELAVQKAQELAEDAGSPGQADADA